MLCIMSAPSKLDKTKYPGAKSRYDDFVAVHMNQTLNIHGTASQHAAHNIEGMTNIFQGSFLSWHRYYTWAFEQTLRNECNYNGTQPVCPDCRACM